MVEGIKVTKGGDLTNKFVVFRKEIGNLISKTTPDRLKSDDWPPEIASFIDPFQLKSTGNA